MLSVKRLDWRLCNAISQETGEPGKFSLKRTILISESLIYISPGDTFTTTARFSRQWTPLRDTWRQLPRLLAVFVFIYQFITSCIVFITSGTVVITSGTVVVSSGTMINTSGQCLLILA